MKVSDLCPTYSPRPEVCADCGATFIAHTGSDVVHRPEAAHEGDESPLAGYFATCGCLDRGADDGSAARDEADEWQQSERYAQAFEPGPTPEEMRDDLDEWNDERAAGLEHAAECGAEDAAEGESAEAGADAHEFAGAMRSAYLDAWADALADDRRRAESQT